ncbi:MAG: trypsin-like serine protease [Deltaproteobacteria bacterium]|nr:trypsin-like serine protease [Deltaproteobacteria bacterium]
MKIAKIALFTGLFAFILSGCSTGPTDSENLGQNQDQIINGLLPDEPMHDAVVSLHERVANTWYLNIYCSGTLIAPDVVLTAAHCLDKGNRRKIVTTSPDELVVYVGDNPMTDPDPIPFIVIETLIHPSYNKFSLLNDIALIRLSSQPGVTPVAALPSSLGLTDDDAGATINFAGFGQDEDGNYDQKLQIDGILDHIYSATQIHYLQDYDVGGPCFGDSGGPAFITRNEIPYVAGITSYGDSYCATYGVSTRPDAYGQFINDFIGTNPEPDCSEDGTCNPECDEDPDPDCTTLPNCSSDNWCNLECDDEDPDPDCGEPVDPFCGDGVCDGGGEDCDSCAADCAEISHPKKGRLACCGNGTCERREDEVKCPVDCL